MTKKDYEKFAKMISNIRKTEDVDSETIDVVISNLCDLFKQDNPRFHLGYFTEACKNTKNYRAVNNSNAKRVSW